MSYILESLLISLFRLKELSIFKYCVNINFSNKIMGGCCQVNSGKNECMLDDQSQINDKFMNARGGNNIYNSNNKSFLDVNILEYRSSFLKCNVNVLEAKENNEIVPEEFRSLIKDKSLILSFPATLDEIALPIWVYENSKITFNVIGQWNIFENENYFDCTGIKDIGNEPTPYNFPVGSLCGYVQGGNVFGITQSTEVVCSNTGPLVLFQNNGDYDVKPKGCLIVIINGGIKQSLEETEMGLGWILEIFEEINHIDFMSNEEKCILYYLNKLRSNPPLFAKLYLTHRKNRSKSDEECFEFLLTLTPIPILKASYELCKASKMHSIDMANNNMTGHISSNGKNLKERLDGLNIDINKIGENCSYGITNPLAIVLELLVDETDSKGHRRNLLDPNFQLIGISLEKHPYWNISCVQDFSKYT